MLTAPPKIVCDTNIFISAIIFWGDPKRILDLAIERKVEIFISSEILTELLSVLARNFNYDEEDLAQTAKLIYGICKFVTPKKRLNTIKSDLTDWV